MKFGYWQHAGGHAMKTHLIEGDIIPICGHPHQGNTSLVTWYDDSLALVDCHNCLRVQRARLRRQMVKCDRRLAGKDGAQADAFMQ